MAESLGNVLFVINSLEGGGAERVFSDLVIHWRALVADERISGIEVALLDDRPRKYSLPSDIAVHQLACGGGTISSFIQLLALARSLKPSAIVSFLTRSNLCSVWVGKLINVPVIISERVNTSSHFANAGVHGAISKFLIRTTYRRANRIVAVSNGVRRDLVGNFNVSDDRVSVIYNPYDLERIRNLADQQILPSSLEGKPYLVVVGRLASNKNQELVLKALSHGPENLHLVLVGEGPEKQQLEKVARDYHIEERVHFVGFQQNPYAFMRSAVAYVSSSLAEGFPNSAAEAMALGVPVIHSDCPSGPAELLGLEGGPVDKETVAPCGILFPCSDQAALSRAIEMLSDLDLKDRLAKAGLNRLAEFTFPAIVGKFEGAIIQAISDR